MTGAKRGDIVGRNPFEMDRYTNVKNLLVIIDNEIASATAMEGKFLPVALGGMAKFWWPNEGRLRIYLDGLVTGKGGMFSSLRVRYIAAAVRRHLERKVNGYILVPVFEVNLDTTMIEPELGVHVFCDVLEIVLDESRLGETMPLPGSYRMDANYM